MHAKPLQALLLCGRQRGLRAAGIDLLAGAPVAIDLDVSVAAQILEMLLHLVVALEGDRTRPPADRYHQRLARATSQPDRIGPRVAAAFEPGSIGGLAVLIGSSQSSRRKSQASRELLAVVRLHERGSRQGPIGAKGAIGYRPGERL